MWVAKSNLFVHARYQLSAAEMRFILVMLAAVQRNDEDFSTYRLFLDDFLEKHGPNLPQEYRRARQITKSLMGRVMEIETEEEVLQIAFLSSVRYLRNRGYLEFRFDTALKPYLLQLREDFTEYDIRNVLPCKSSYSMRMYELLKSFQGCGEMTITLEKLKDILMIQDKYPFYGDVKRHILKTAERELRQHSDIGFHFEEIRQGRKVVALKFTVQERQQRQLAFPKPEVPPELVQKAGLRPAAGAGEKQPRPQTRRETAGTPMARGEQAGRSPAAEHAALPRNSGSHYQYIDGVLTKDGVQIMVDEIAD